MLRPCLPTRRAVLAGGAALVVALAVAGCTPSPEPSASATPTESATTVTASPTPSAPPALVPGGTAEANLAFFRAITETVWSSADPVSGRAYIDALTAAGFDRAAMQVTNDTTTIGDAAESIQFSVLWTDGQCLVGQVGPATGAPVTAVLPALGDATCLLGLTRPIDW